MLFKDFLENRTSTREYKNTKVEESKLNILKNFAKEIENRKDNENIEFLFYENGKKIYKNLKGEAGYAGIMIKSPHYIGIGVKDQNDVTFLRASYAMENLLTRAHELGLGSCWINVMDTPYESKKVLLSGDNKYVNYIVAIGYPKKESRLSEFSSSDGLENEDIGYLSTIRPFREKKYFVEKSTSARLAVSDIVFKNEFGNKISSEELDQRGLDELFYYIRYAPSDKNQQPWRFILKSNSVFLAILGIEDKNNLTDAGIMMYYFEEMAKSIGYKGEWLFIPEGTQKYEDVEYNIVGEYVL